MGSSSVLEPSVGILERDEMCDVLGDIITDDDLFTTLRSELYTVMSSFSSLNFLVKLMHLKVLNKCTNKSFDELLKLLKLAFLKMDLIDSCYEAKKLMTKIGLGYKSIHMCKNDCALLWNEKSSKETCPVCSESRWKLQSGKRSGKKVPYKVLRYFPVGPRLKLLFVTLKTVKLMRWHSTGKSKDNDVMRHPVDGIK